MAELLLGALLPVLFERLLSPSLLDLANREKVGDLVKKWNTKLKSISKLLDDAEDKAMRGDESVKLWLDDLRDLVYDIEDVMDEFVTEEGIPSLSTECAGGGSITGNVRSSLPSCCTGKSPRKLILDHQLRSRMEKIGGRLDSILEQKKDLELIESGGSRIKKTTSHSSKRMTTSLPECKVVGRQQDEKAFLAKLLTEETEDLSVIPIVGIGGLGKTTLAKSVFNHSTVEEAFPLRGWACVSDNFDKLAIAKALLGSLTSGSAGDGGDLNVLHNKLREILSKQKFLIVLDDYWSTDYPDWAEIYNLFNLGVKGSKVIVTTRDEGVASMMTNRQPFRLEKLSDGDCLSLLAYHAFGVSNFDAHTHLKPIGEEIAVKCKGLPLAAKALGGLLRSKPKTASEWEDIRDSKIWNLEPGKDDIFLALKLSYIHLPPHLKRCFVFCAIFPEDHEFDRDDLVLLWMGEGLVEVKRKNGRSRMLDQGRKQFDELMSRSFFQPSTQNETRFVMHDLMHDLAISIGGNTCLNFEGNKIEDVKYKSPEKVRHMFHSSKHSAMDEEFKTCHILKGLRTFITSHRPYFNAHLSDEALEEFLQNLKYLRVLSLRWYTIDKIPNCIGRLKHLRYLKFSGCSRLKELPESVCTLYNLEALILNGCSDLTELPPGMDKLINLKCLDIKDTPKLKKMPVELGRMRNFEILSKFIVGRSEDGLRLKVLGNLQHLQGEISIWNLQNVEDVGDARDTRLSDKVGLTTLALRWGSRNDFGNVDKQKQVLEFLQPHHAIKEVEIDGYGSISFPSWIGCPSMTHITKVRLESCATSTTLPSFGLLPCLRELEMTRMDAVCSVGSEFYGSGKRPPFPSLEVLKFKDMPAWEVWSSSCGDKEIEEPFPRLIKLELRNCPRLVSLPSFGLLPCLRELEMERMDAVCSVGSEFYGNGERPPFQSLEVLTFKDMPAWEVWSSSCGDKEIEEPFPRLITLDLRNCPRLVSHLPHRLCSLVNLVIHKCPLLKASPCMADMSSLKDLILIDCNHDLLAMISSVSRSAPVERIYLERIQKLKYLNEDTLRAAECLEISNCEELTGLWEDNVTEPVLASLTRLKDLRIRYCENLQKFPNNIHRMTSLRELSIVGCSRLKRPLEEWGLHRLTTLKELIMCGEIGSLCLQEGGIMTCFPPIPSDWRFFPSNLEILQILYQRDMVRLSDGLRDHLTSLRRLSLVFCPKLQFLPKEGFPPSLEYLHIIECSQDIKSKCSKNGEYFPLIGTIPDFRLTSLN